MDKHFEVGVGQVDFDSLNTDEDFRRAAERLLPSVIQKTGETLSEEAWRIREKSLRAAGVTATPAQKRDFVRDFCRIHEREASTTHRKTWLDNYILQLREQKAEQAAKPR